MPPPHVLIQLMGIAASRTASHHRRTTAGSDPRPDAPLTREQPIARDSLTNGQDERSLKAMDSVCDSVPVERGERMEAA